MAIPGRIEEGLIQHRYGYSHDLPDYLEEAEIAMTVDTGGVFIGAPMFKAIDGRERSHSNIYPYHNIELLTEVSNNTEIIKIPFNIFNTSLDMPIVLVAYTEPATDLAPTDIIAINGMKINIDASDLTLAQKVARINDIIQSNNNNKKISVDIYNNKLKITFYSKNGESLILDSLTANSLQRFGFINPIDTYITHKVISPKTISSRSLGDVLSDNISIKSFGVENNAQDNCAVLTNAAIDILYRNEKEYLKKSLVFPSGEYNYNSDAIYLTSDAKFVGENQSRLVFSNATDLMRMVSNTDINGLTKQSSLYGKNKGDIKDIELKDLDLVSKESLNGMEFYGVSDLVVKNCNITSKHGTTTEPVTLFSISTTTGRGTYLTNISDILYDGGCLDNAEYGISIEGKSDTEVAKNIVIKNVKFTNITENCINLKNCENVIIEHCDFSDASNLKLFVKVENCKNVIIRDCIYPNGFILNKNDDNKIKFMNSSVSIEDYVEVVGDSENNSIVLYLPNQSIELFTVKLDYDILSPYVANRSGSVVAYHNSTYQPLNIRDTGAICDTSILFALRNGADELGVESNRMKIVCQNTTPENVLIRYKLTFITLNSSYTYIPVGGEDTIDEDTWMPSVGGFDPEEINRMWNEIHNKQDILNTNNAGNNVTITTDPLDNNVKINAIDTTYTAGTNVSINSNNVISAVDTTYTGDKNIVVDATNHTISTENVVDYTNISNCIINVPQDIKLELNSGSLILKAGSKFYKPNGLENLSIILENDITLTKTWSTTNPLMLFYTIENNDKELNVCEITNCSSGSTDSISGIFHFWYDTNNNLIRIVEGDGTIGNATATFPLAIIKMVGDSTSTVTSIEQVFNGFGYIGSHVFFTKGFSVLTPNGRNIDGTLANRRYTFTDCAIYAKNITDMNIPIWVRYNGQIEISNGEYYDTVSNQSFDEPYYTQVATATLTNGVISDFQPRQVFHAIDYSDTDYIAQQSVPSNEYKNINVDTSPFTHTAITNGYISIKLGNDNNPNANVTVVDSLQIMGVSVSNNSWNYLPVRKGETYTITWDANDSNNITLKFVYSEGSK